MVVKARPVRIPRPSFSMCPGCGMYGDKHTWKCFQEPMHAKTLGEVWDAVQAKKDKQDADDKAAGLVSLQTRK